MPGFRRPHWYLQNRVVNFPVDVLQALGIDVVRVEAHLVFFALRRRSKGPPVASNVVTIQTLIEVARNGSTHMHPQLSQKWKAIMRSPQIYSLVAEFGFFSILTSSGW
jgi:tRNA A37 threonylcarbamoyladenosine synthetase subunit TsaC/SUA5/YrdC